MSSTPFTVDPQTLLHLRAALVDFRLGTPSCPECGGDAQGKPHHESNCSFGRAVHLVDAMLSDDYQRTFTAARLRCEKGPRHQEDRNKGRVRLSTRYGRLWVRHYPPLSDGPGWACQERVLIDASPDGGEIFVNGQTMPLQGHLFQQANGKFRFSERDRQKYPACLLDELEQEVNSLQGRVKKGFV